MKSKNLLLLKAEFDRRSRLVLKHRYKAANPKIRKVNGKDVVIDRLTGVTTVDYSKDNNGLNQTKEASIKYRNSLRLSAKENPLASDELKKRCLRYTKLSV